MHQKSSILLAVTALMVLVCVPAGIAAAETSELKSFSGYILDSDGHGIAGARIQLIVGSPYFPYNITDETGHYEFEHWTAEEVMLRIYPPNNSNFVDYANDTFLVQPGVTTNFTLTRGFKLSGYVLDQNGNPAAAEVYLDGYWSGQWSNFSTGSFWVSAPAGTYSVRVLGGPSRWGSSSFVYEVLNKTITLDHDVTGNIIVKAPEPTPIATVQPTPTVPEFSGLIVLALAIAGAASLICAKKTRGKS